MHKNTSALIQCVTSMVIFGTIGLFVRNIDLSSDLIAGARGLIGVLFLLIVCLIKSKKPSIQDIKRNFVYLCVSGALIGANWVLLFESYRYTTVAVSTLCYYMAPVFVILTAPFVLKEKMTIKKLCCILISVIGMIFVSGAFSGSVPESREIRGLFFGLGAAALYASVILINQKLKDISAYDKTIVQLFFASAIIIPYSILKGSSFAIPNVRSGILLMVVGIIHTGFAYAMYFGSMDRLNAQSVAIIGYIDPVVAVILSVLLLKESFTLFTFIGAVLILGAAFAAEWKPKKLKS